MAAFVIKCSNGDILCLNEPKHAVKHDVLKLLKTIRWRRFWMWSAAVEGRRKKGGGVVCNGSIA